MAPEQFQYFRWFLPLVEFLVLLTVPSLCLAQERKETSKPKPKEFMVAMADGVKLATDVYLPGDGKGKYPAVIVRTPYSKVEMRTQSDRLLQNGYAVVAQDVRGQFKSEGKTAIIFRNDGWKTPHDGHDAIAWIAQQPWSNGKVGSWGSSVRGITQNMMAPGAPDAYQAQHVIVAYSDFYSQFAYPGGVFRKNLLGKFLELMNIVDTHLPVFVAHPRYDSFWADLNPEAQAARVNAAGVFSGGWYDIFQQGTINSFVAIQNHGGPRARGKCRLIIYPSGHGPVKDLSYPLHPENIPLCADEVKWFDHILKGEANGIEKEKPVHYYVMGDPIDPKAPGNYWRHVDVWPPKVDVTPFYFHGDGTLHRNRPVNDDRKTYKYDPRNPVPHIGGNESVGEMGPKDQRKVEDRPDVLIFSSEVLKEPVEVTGRITGKLYVSSDCPDTDFTVKLCDVYPDGRSMIVTDGILRARDHKSFEKEDFLQPGKVYELNVDLWSTSLIFNKGHRLRVAVSSSNAPRFEPNPNTGRPFRAEADTRVATNTVHLSAKHPSHVLLPIYAEERKTKP